MDFLDIAHYKYNWNSFKFWKLDHRFWSVQQTNKQNGLDFYSTYWAGIIQTGPSVIKPFIKKVAHSETNLKYILSNFPIQLKNWKN